VQHPGGAFFGFLPLQIGVTATVLLLLLIRGGIPPLQPVTTSATRHELPARATGPASLVITGANARAEAVAEPKAAAGIAVASSLPYSLAAQYIYVAPDRDAAVLGLVPKSARLDVAGRDETGTWLAVTLAPAPRLYGWLPLAGVGDPPNWQRLKVIAPTSLR
jgi:hypothetical protein